ncbi:MAG: hypothetical protein NVS4B2_11300 [Chloroflexota bacterium]
MKSRVFVLALLLALMTGVAAPQFAGHANAKSTQSAAVTSHPAAFDKTKFLFHLGLAFGAFHHFVYKPYKAGQLNTHHKLNLVKAALAAAFTYHEVKKAYQTAQGSNSKTLKLLIAPLNGLAGGFNALSTKIRHGDASGAESLNTQTSGYESLAGKNGYSISEQTPTAGQLSSAP